MRILIALLSVLLAFVVAACASNPGASECITGIFCPDGSQCAAAQRVCITTDCGNGLLDSGEACDDGNILESDGCSSTCKIEDCGNGIQDPGEFCDDGNTVPGDNCSPTCTIESCGNTTTDFGEICDDGNTVSGDGCSMNCQSREICGNNIVDTSVGEVCDDGNTANGDTCASDCRSGAGCGNGSIDLDMNGNPIEECDDGNTDSSDDCRADCIVNRCGDGFPNTTGAVDTREDCDPATPATTGSKVVNPLETSTCNIDCSTRSCGDAKINKAAGEQCDNGASNADNRDCTALCVVNVCGDAHPNLVGPSNIEQCDDGNTSEIDGCSTSCTVPFCGNGIVDMGEGCDHGSQNNDTAACRADCQINVCGDGRTRTGVEQCDDGNTTNGDNCSSICRNEVCGNGIKDPLEACDDGNLTNGDGCSSTCVFESCGDGIENNGEECDTGGESATCNADCTDRACGDGKVNQAAGEQCDELNVVDTDNCISNNNGNAALRCKLNACGDGVQDNAAPRIEACDDGNTNNNDGCSNSCTLPTCGNNIRDMGEECDDGNASDTDACVSCNNAFCGDGEVRIGVEQCDDADTTNGDGCDNNCTTSACGNGIRAGSEACDDGNTTNGDGCSSTCVIETCGNSITNPGEDCDDGGESATCNADCTTRACGDGKVNQTAGEQCDELNAVDTDNCISNGNGNPALRCKLNVCGDGVIDNAAPGIEGCDDGDTDNTDGCSNSCTTPSCGNGILDQGEQCDDANTADNDGCLSSNSSGATNCKIAICGDGVQRTVGSTGTEACDDGNAINTDDCLNSCELNACGDGFRDQQGPTTEPCDDGNVTTETECPYNVISCQVCSNVCALVNRTGDFCGDGTTDAADGEVCDDGNRVTEASCPYDTAPCTLCNANCSAVLNLANGPVCGDGTTDAVFEVCDDNNALACGTCSADCRVPQTDKSEGFIFPIPGADYVAGGTDTFTLDDGINPATTFQFTNGAPTGSNIAIAFNNGDSNVTMRNRIETAIDGVGATLLIDAARAPASNPTVILTHDFVTSQGNIDIINGVAHPSFGTFGMTGGQGGDCPINTSCNSDEVCSSFDCDATDDQCN